MSRAFRGEAGMKIMSPLERKYPTAYRDRGSCMRKGNTNCVSMGETSVLSNWEE